MKNRIGIITIIAILGAAFVFGGAGRASAVSAPWIKATGGVAGICTLGGSTIHFPVDVDINLSGSDHAELKVPGVGTPGTYSEDYNLTLSGPTTYGLPTSAYSVPANTPLTFQVTTYNGAGQSGGISSFSFVTFDCSTGAVINSYFGDASYAAVPVPTGFVQTRILCDAPVFDQPNGTRVGDNMVREGQAWYVNPTPVVTSTGEKWSEIFLAGPNNAYIRSSCVGGPV